MTTYVYLDQNAWIELGRTYHNRSDNHKKALEAIIEASNSGTAIFPLSMVHFIETSKRRNDGSRKRLVETMMEISKGFTMLPWTYIIKPEVRNAIYRLKGQPEKNLKKYVFGRGIAKMFGGKITLKGNGTLPDTIKNDIVKRINSVKVIQDFLVDRELSQNIVDSMGCSDEGLAKRLEELRKTEYSHPDKTKRKAISKVRFIQNVVMDPLIKETMKLGMNIQDLFQIDKITKKNIEDLLKSMPTIYTYYILNEARNMNFSRPIRPNDLYDLSALNIAIPYCDIVVTEREWTNIAKQRGLDTKNETTIIHDLNELTHYL